MVVPAAAPGDVTELLRAAAAGERPALDRVFELLYGELQRIAAHQRRAVAPGSTLDTTALVHEAYLKLSQHQAWSTRDRSHFFALAARAMRQILIDGARRRSSRKRGGGGSGGSGRSGGVGGIGGMGGSGGSVLDEIQLSVPESERAPEDLLALDRALEKLAAIDGDLVRLVEHRYFAGLTIEEVAELTDTSPSTLKRRWRAARAFLYAELSEKPASSSSSSSAR